MNDQSFDRRDFLKGAVVGGAAAAAAPLRRPAAEAQAQQPPRRGGRASRLRIPQSRRGGVRRGAGRSHGAGRRADAEGHRHRHQHLHRPRARRRLGQGRPALHAGAVEAGRAEPGLSAAADARAALPRRHRGDQRALPQDLRQDRSTSSTSSSARRCCVGLSGRQDHLRQRPAGARVLEHASIRP